MQSAKRRGPRRTDGTRHRRAPATERASWSKKATETRATRCATSSARLRIRGDDSSFSCCPVGDDRSASGMATMTHASAGPIVAPANRSTNRPSRRSTPLPCSRRMPDRFCCRYTQTSRHVATDPFAALPSASGWIAPDLPESATRRFRRDARDETAARRIHALARSRRFVEAARRRPRHLLELSPTPTRAVSHGRPRSSC